jgi:malate permease and related proteins
MAGVNDTFFLSLSIIGLGYLLKKLKILKDTDGKSLSKIIFNVTLPALILSTVPYVEFNSALIIMPIIPIVVSAFILAFSIPLLRKIPKEQKGVMLMTVIGYNVGNFAYPLVEGIWGTTGLQYVAMYDVGNALVMFVMVYIIAAINSSNSEDKSKKDNQNINTEEHDSEESHNDLDESSIDPKKILKKIVTSIPLLCYIFSIIMNVVGFNFPPMAIDIIGIIARANMAIVLITLGIFLNFKFEKSEWRNILIVIVIRYIVGLSLGFLLYFLLPFEQYVRMLILISLIIPIGLATVTYTVEFDYSEKSQQMVGTLVNFTLIISFFLMWAIIAILGTGL